RLKPFWRSSNKRDFSNSEDSASEAVFFRLLLGARARLSLVPSELPLELAVAGEVPTGNSTFSLVPCSRASRASVTSSTVSFLTSPPQRTQYVRPTRANSRRR